MTSTSTTKRFIVLGDAGAGKSSFINFLFNYFNGTKNPDEIFSDYPKVKIVIPCANWIDCLDESYKDNKSEYNINDQTQSQTQLCTTYTVGQPNNIRLEIIDTPGFNDTNGTDVDTTNLTMIEKALKEVPFLNGIILVVNGSSTRLGVSFKNFLHMLHQIWPNNLMNNCVAILTNCDELSVNIDSLVLERELNVDKSKKFHLQNSFFRWNRKPEPKKTVLRFQQDFEDNIETIKVLFIKLLEFEDVSTKSFSVSAIKISIIEKCIHQSIYNMVDLLEKYKEQQTTEAGIEGARETMENNKQWEKQHEIHAIRWEEVPRGRPPTPKRLQDCQPQKILHNEQQRMQPQDQETIKSKTSVGGERHSGCSNRPEQFVPDHKMSSSRGGKHGSKTTSNNKSSSGHCHPSESDGLYHRPGTGGSQYDVGGRVPQYGREAGGSQNGPGVSESQHATEAGGSPHGVGAGGSQPGMGYSGSHYRTGTSGPHNPEIDNRRYNAYGTRTGYNDDNGRRDVHSKKSLFSNCFDFGDSGGKYSDFSHRPVYQQQQTKIQVTLPDNEAREQHKYAERQESWLKNRTQDLIDEKQFLKGSLMLQLEQLRKQVAELRSINKRYDILEQKRDLLTSFREIIKYMGEDSDMLSYYNDTIAILSHN